MKRMILAVIVGVMGFSTYTYADGCYMCAGKSDTYVKFTGDDTNDKRKQAENCGCRVSGTRSDCYAANLTVLCTVSYNEKGNQTGALACAAGNYTHVNSQAN